MRRSSLESFRAPRDRPVEVLIAIVFVALVVLFVTVPLRRSAESSRAGDAGDDDRRAVLEARKQAKYREIRDTELDRAQGKLTEADFQRQNSELRAEAIAILKQIDTGGSTSEGRAPGTEDDGDAGSARDSV